MNCNKPWFIVDPIFILSNINSSAIHVSNYFATRELSSKENKKHTSIELITVRNFGNMSLRKGKVVRLTKHHRPENIRYRHQEAKKEGFLEGY